MPPFHNVDWSDLRMRVWIFILKCQDAKIRHLSLAAAGGCGTEKAAEQILVATQKFQGRI